MKNLEIDKILSGIIAILGILLIVFLLLKSCSILEEDQDIKIKKYDVVGTVKDINYADQLKIKNIDIDLYNCEISGIIKNTLGKYISYIEVELVWYDENRKILTRDILTTDLKKGQEWPVLFYWRGIEYDEYSCYCEMNIERVEVK